MDIEGKIKVAGIIKESVTDGPGLRYVIFGQGCKHKCEGCQNPHTHDYTKGGWRNITDIYDDICNNPLLDGVTFSGGEPFMQSNKFATLSHMIKDNEKTKHLDIICYSGYTWGELMWMMPYVTSASDLIRTVDYIIDGRFEKDKKTLDCPFRGSSNQRFIDVKMSLNTGEIITVM